MEYASSSISPTFCLSIRVCAYDTVPIYCAKMPSLCSRIAHTPRVQRNEKRILINKQFKMKEQENISVGVIGVEMQTTLTRKKRRMCTSFCSAWKFNGKCQTSTSKCNATHQLWNECARVCACVCVYVCVEKQFHVIAIEAVSTTI